MQTRHSYFLALLPVLLATGCTPLKPVTPTQDYLSDAHQCDKQTQSTVKTRINLGGIENIQMPMGTDSPQYRICLERRGWKNDPAKEPYVALSETCMKAARASTTRTSEDGSKISNEFDSAYYQECMQNEGKTGIVIVHPVKSLPPE